MKTHATFFIGSVCRFSQIRTKRWRKLYNSVCRKSRLKKRSFSISGVFYGREKYGFVLVKSIFPQTSKMRWVFHVFITCLMLPPHLHFWQEACQSCLVQICENMFEMKRDRRRQQRMKKKKIRRHLPTVISQLHICKLKPMIFSKNSCSG